MSEIGTLERYELTCRIIDAISANPHAKAARIAELSGAPASLVGKIIGTLKIRLRMAAEAKMDAHVAKLEGLINPAVDTLARAMLPEEPDNVAVTAARDVLDRVGPQRTERNTIMNPDGSNFLTGIKVIEVGKL